MPLQLVLALVQGSASDKAVDVISQYDPLMGVIASLLLAAIAALTGVVVFLFRLFNREARRKDLVIEAKEEQIDNLNEFTRKAYQESTQVMGDMIRVVDVLSQTTEDIGDDVRKELSEFLKEIREHLYSVSLSVKKSWEATRSEDAAKPDSE